MHAPVAESFQPLLMAQRYAEAGDLPARDGRELYARAFARTLIGREQEARDDYERCRAELGDLAAIELAFLDIRQRGDLDRGGREAGRIAGSAAAGTFLRARAHHVLGLAEGKKRRSQRSVAALLIAADEYAALDDRASLAQVRDTLGSVFAAQGRLDLAACQYTLSLVAKLRAGDQYGIALTLGNLGRLHLRAGRTREALQCLEQDLEIARELGDQRGQARVHEDLGRAWLEAGDVGRARTEFERSLALAGAHGYGDLEFFAHKDLAIALACQGEHSAAELELERARAKLPRGGEGYLETVLLAAEGECALAAGRPDALEKLERAADELARNDLADMEIAARILLAEACQRRGLWEAAEDALTRAAGKARLDGYARFLPRVREAMTRLRIVPGLASAPEGVAGRPAAAPEPGVAVKGGYVLLERVGKGGYGEVWRAYDPELGKVVALKTIVLDDVYAPDERTLCEESLHRELEAAARIRHPGLVRVYAVGRDAEERMYVVEEFVRGAPLAKSLPKLPTAEPLEVLGVLARIAHALAELHGQGIVHRDLKPANVLLRAETRQPVLIDLGFAVIQDQRRDWERNLVVGTIPYMAPEQAGGEIDVPADLYALGVIAFEWLAGVRPIRPRGTTFVEMARDLQKRDAPPLSDFRRGLPDALVQLVADCLARKPKHRPSAAAVARRCEEIEAALRK